MRLIDLGLSCTKGGILKSDNFDEEKPRIYHLLSYISNKSK